MSECRGLKRRVKLAAGIGGPVMITTCERPLAVGASVIRQGLYSTVAAVVDPPGHLPTE
jgi:hypothetical protein